MLPRARHFAEQDHVLRRILPRSHLPGFCRLDGRLSFSGIEIEHDSETVVMRLTLVGSDGGFLQQRYSLN